MMWKALPGELILMKFGLMEEVVDVIIYAKICRKSIEGVWCHMVEIHYFPLNLDVAVIIIFTAMHLWLTASYDKNILLLLVERNVDIYVYKCFSV